MKWKCVILFFLSVGVCGFSEILVQEHFATNSNTKDSVPGWTPVQKLKDSNSIGESSELLTGGLSYGALSGIDLLKSRAEDGYVYNDNPVGNNRFSKLLNSPVSVPEGSILYFGALVKGAKRANFGLGTFDGGSFPAQLISIGINPQILDANANYPQKFSASVWKGNPNSTGLNNGVGVEISQAWENEHLIIGRLVNNPGATDEISYHVIDVNSWMSVPGEWVGEKLPWAAGFYSRTDFDFGENPVFTHLLINLQNHSGLDEIYFSTQYTDIIQ
ncbi:MAG: hypothetical protein AB7E95_04060 [Kiritimatiellales bacterium]